MLNVGLIGTGYWGKNLRRVLAHNPGFCLKAAADRNPELRASLHKLDPGLTLHVDAEDILGDRDIAAVVIATPAASHYDLARRALRAGKHVLVEKPMSCTSEEAADLAARAERSRLTLMVDHTFLFHPAVTKLAALVSQKALGAISYYDSQRINLGLFQPDVNVLWDLAPHDLAILDLLFGEEPIHIEASGYCHLNPGLPDIAYVTLHYPSSTVAHLNLSWMSPVKMRRVALGGAAKMVVWDDLDRNEPLKIYDSGINALPQSERDVILPSYRAGDVLSPRLAPGEPLTAVVEHFLQVVRGTHASRMDGRAGLRVVRTLERIQAALDINLYKVQRLYSAARPARTLVAAE